MIPPTLEMCPLILKFETSPLSMLLLQPRQMALGGHPDGEQRGCLAELSSAHWPLSLLQTTVDMGKPNGPRVPAL